MLNNELLVIEILNSLDFVSFSVGDLHSPINYNLWLWDTITNEITIEDSPTGYEETSFFRPTLLPYDDFSFIVVSAEIENSGNKDELQEIWQYVYGFGWIKISANPAPLNALEQTGAFWLDNNPPIDDFESLNKCAF